MHPRLVDLGNFGVPTYGVLVATGIVAGLLLTSRLARKAVLNVDHVWNLAVTVILSAIIGAKVLYIVNDWSFYRAHPRAIFSLDTLQAGGVFAGGLLAAFVVAWIILRKTHLPALKTADCFAPGIALGHAIGRMGCFMAGCCYGKETTVPWAVTFTNPLANRLVGTPLGVHLHPTQLYESGAELVNLGILLWLFRRKQFDGQVMGAYLFLYGVERFFIEFWRGDPGRGEVFGGMMSGTQLIAIVFVIAGGVLWMRRSKTASVPATA
jgi:phosphatidylglycerol---prolipoprotein diacylglyceryl transferase